MTVLFLMLSACGTSSLPALAPAPADLTVEVAEKQVESGAPVQVSVATWSADGWTVPTPQPLADGLTATLLEQDGPTLVGGRARRTYRPR